jgi:hypothetical protein
MYLILFIVYLICKQHKLGTEKRKKEYVCQIIHGDWQIDHYHTDYNFSYFEMIQRHLKVADKYKFTKNDEKQVMRVFEEFKNNLSEEYFSNRIGLPKTKFVLDNNTFLFYSLYIFLDKKYCSTCFCENPMHKETITLEYYSTDGYCGTYTVTEFAIVVFKLFYTSYIFCKNSKILNPKGEFFKNESHIEKLIDTQKISIACYRP